VGELEAGSEVADDIASDGESESDYDQCKATTGKEARGIQAGVHQEII
jgi:hypothetical protein